MKTFKQLTESDDYASMPHDHLHYLLHDEVTKNYGYTRGPTFNGNEYTPYVEHSYTHHPGNPNGQRFDEEDIGAPGDLLIHEGKLEEHGWKRDMMGDVWHDGKSNGFNSKSFVHPNGSRLHIQDNLNESGDPTTLGEWESSIRLKHPVSHD